MRVPPEVQAQDEREAAEAGMEADVVVVQAEAVEGDTAAPAPGAGADAAGADAEPQKVCLSKAFPEVRGHTSYLTFAVLLPARVRALAADAEAGGRSAAPSAPGSVDPTPPPLPLIAAGEVSAWPFPWEPDVLVNSSDRITKCLMQAKQQQQQQRGHDRSH